MCPLSLECGISTVSWNAVFALRRRVNMSAIGSVIVMVDLLSRRGSRAGPAAKVSRRGTRRRRWVLPGRLRHARQFAGVGHFAEADPAQAELAVDGLRATAALA